MSGIGGCGIVVATVNRRQKYGELVDYYYRAAAILRDRVPQVPFLWLSDATSYYGSALRRTGETQVHSIALSTKRCWPIDHEELLDTIAHELAHTVYYEHCPQHTRITEWFKTILLDNWTKKDTSLEGA